MLCMQQYIATHGMTHMQMHTQSSALAGVAATSTYADWALHQASEMMIGKAPSPHGLSKQTTLCARVTLLLVLACTDEGWKSKATASTQVPILSSEQAWNEAET